MNAPRHRSAYGWRAKLGLIVPPTNTVNEAEWSRLVPEGVSFHTARMPLHAATGGEAGTDALLADLDRPVADLRSARVDVVAYACTAGSMIVPADALPRRMAERSGVASVSTAAAIVAALAALGAGRVAVATPYHDALNDHEVEFLRASGFEVAAIRGLGIGAGGPAEYPRIAETPLAEVRAHALSVLGDGLGADALLITCTDFPTLAIVEPLEEETGLPVVTSNTATLWQTLRTAGIADALATAGRLGRLP